MGHWFQWVPSLAELCCIAPLLAPPSLRSARSPTPPARPTLPSAGTSWCRRPRWAPTSRTQLSHTLLPHPAPALSPQVHPGAGRLRWARAGRGLFAGRPRGASGSGPAGRSHQMRARRWEGGRGRRGERTGGAWWALEPAHCSSSARCPPVPPCHSTLPQPPWVGCKMPRRGQVASAQAAAASIESQRADHSGSGQPAPAAAGQGAGGS